MINKRRRSVLPFLIFFLHFISLSTFSQSNYSVFYEGQKVGLQSWDNEVLIPAEFQDIGWTNGQKSSVDGVIGYYENGLWGIITLNGKIITKPKYYSLEPLGENVILASLKGRFSNLLFYGTINPKGETIVSFQDRSIEKLKKGLVIISKVENQKQYWGLYTLDNTLLAPQVYREISLLDSGLLVFTDSTGQKGIMNDKGIVKVRAELDSIGDLEDGYVKVYQTGKAGLIDSKGNYILKAENKRIDAQNTPIPFHKVQIRTISNEVESVWYVDSLAILRHGLLALYTNGFVQILDAHSNTIYEGESPHRIDYVKNYIVLHKRGKVSLLDVTNKSRKRSLNFDSIIIDEPYIFGSISGYWKIYNTNGFAIIEKKFEAVLSGSENLIPVKRNGYWGYVDHTGETAISLKYDSVSPFKKQLASVNHLGYRYLINQFGETVGKTTTYDSIHISTDNTAIAKIRSRTDLIDQNGRVLFQTYHDLSKHKAGYLETTELGDRGLINNRGNVIFHPIYDSISELMEEQFVIIKQSEKSGLFYKNGTALIPLTDRFEEIGSVSGRFISIKQNNQYGFINYNEQLIISNRYDSTGVFEEALVAVKLNDHWGFLNEKEQLVIQPNLDFKPSFKYGRVIVSRKGLYGVYDTKGVVKIEMKFDSIYHLGDQYMVTIKSKKRGLYDLNGRKILDTSFEEITPTWATDYFIVRRRGKEGVLSADGLYKIPLIYDRIVQLDRQRFSCTSIPN